MELYAIIGFVALVLITAIWAAMRAARSAAKVERESARADANEAAKEETEKAREWEHKAQSKWNALRLLPLACLILVASTGCTRTVYVQPAYPRIPLQPLPLQEAEKEQWMLYATILRGIVEDYNREFAGAVEE